jgi:pimeloyl-ACP methyl ester carboxylesterase
VRLYVEDTGTGDPIVFVHELHSDHREWEAQVRWFSRLYRCVAFNARGYPPSDVPADSSLYGYPIVVHDIAAVVRALGISKAHIVGSSMGAYAALHFGWMYPELARSLVIAGVGSGSPAADRAVWVTECEATARAYLDQGAPAVAESCRPHSHSRAASAQESSCVRGIPVPFARAFGGRQVADHHWVSGAASIARGLSESILDPSDPGILDRRR